MDVADLKSRGSFKKGDQSIELLESALLLNMKPQIYKRFAGLLYYKNFPHWFCHHVPMAALKGT